MPGEKNLDKLLASLAPRLLAGEYVFCTFPQGRYGDHAALEPIAAVSEEEGLTLVVPQAKADAQGLDYASTFCAITLTVHSSLEAVGLTAAIARRLTRQGISANMIAGYFHDHVFVQRAFAREALVALQSLAAEADNPEQPE